ncbi:MAG: hypothetical protein P1V36_14150 [Planctomycetota bacterium]|nr:hypothetical protein [Planctomycetota bacterium]
MARKATDLLEVFRYDGDDNDEGEGRSVSNRRGRSAQSSSAKKAQAKKAKAKKGKGFDGLIVTRRQVILGASVCCLLVALSFVLGLSAGRPGQGDTPAASRTQAGAQGFIIQGEMPIVHTSTQKPIGIAGVKEELVREYRVPASNLRVRAEDGRLILEIGLFGSEDEARRYLRRSQLDMAHIFGSDPFQNPRYLPRGR